MTLTQESRSPRTTKRYKPLNLTKAALELRRQLWNNEVFTADDVGVWRVEAGILLTCARNAHFPVAVAMGIEPVQLPLEQSHSAPNG